MSFVEEISLRADDKASSVLAGVSSQLRGLIRDLGALAGISVGFAGLAQLVRTGLEFNATLEDTRIGIGGVVGALNTFRNSSGEVLRGEEAWNAALRVSTSLQEQLKSAALTTTATYTEMVDAFQIGIGPMTRAGIAMTDTVEATQRLTQVAAAASIPMAQLSVEMRQFFAGDVVRGRLLQTLQITKEQIEEHKRLGDMMDFIRQKTESYARAAQAAADSMTGRVSNLKDAIQQSLGYGLQPVYETLKKTLGTITDQFVSFGRDARGNLTAQFNQEFLGRIRAFGDALAQILAKFGPLLATTVVFTASFLAAGAKALAAFSPVLDLLTAVLGILTKLTDAVGEWAVGVWLVVKAFTALETAARAAGVAAAAARALGAGGGAAAAGTAAGGAAAAGGGAGLLATVGGSTAAGIAAVGAALAYLANVIAKEIGDKFGANADGRIQKAWYDTRTDSQVLADSQRFDVASVLSAAQVRAVASGNSTLAKSIGEVVSAYRMQTISTDEAIGKLRQLSAVGRETFQANKEAADPAVLQKYADAVEKINGQIAAMGQTGVTAALTKSRTDYLSDIAKLREEMKTLEKPKEKVALRTQVGARADLWKAEQAKALRDYQNELSKQRLEIARENDAISQAWLEGGAKEVAAISSKAAETVAALEQERAQVQRTDGLAVEKIQGLTTKIRQALERRGAEMAEWARSAWDKYRGVEIDATQTSLSAAGNEVEAQLLGLSEKYRKLREELNNALVGAMANPAADGALAKIVAAIKAVQTAEAAETEKLLKDERLRIATVRGDWHALAADIEDRVARGLTNAREGLKELGDAMVRFGESYGEGALGAVYTILAEIPTKSESAAAAVTGVWQGMARTFDDGFYTVLTGRLDSLKDVFKSLWDSILRTFSQFLSDMLQRWIKTQIEMSQSGQLKALPGATIYNADGTATSLPKGANGLGLPQSGWQGAAAGAGIGLGFGSMIGQLGNGKYNQTGGMFGGTIGGAIGGSGALAGLGLAGWAGPIAAVVGALIGTLIGALLSPNTLQHVKGSVAAMVGAESWIPDAWKKQGKGGVDEFGDPLPDTFVPGHWGASPTATTELEVAGKKIFEAQTATFADLFRLGAKDQSRDLLASYRQALKDSVSGANFDINAGSEGTIQDVTDYVKSKLLPRIGLSAAFGQTGYLPVGNQDQAGGVGNFSWGMPGMNPDGTWKERKLFSEDSPLFKMMVGIKDASGAYADGLGFTVEKFAELAKRISTDDPAKLLEYITGIVGVVVGLKKLGGEMGKTFGQLRADWKAELDAGVAASFGTTAADLADLFNNLDLYSGDEQLKKAQEAQAASEQFWQSVLTYLQQLDALQQKLSASIQGQRATVDDFLAPKSDAQKIAGAQQTIDETWGKLLNATTPAAVEAAATAAQQAIDTIFGLMAERITRGKALLQTIGGIVDKLGSLSADIAFAQLEQTNPLQAWGQEVAKIQGKIADAARLSGLEQIAALEDVGASAEDMYQNLRGFLADVAAASKSIRQSINSQVWELGVGEMDPEHQAGAIGQRIKELQEQLRLATSPAEIQAITSEIQSLTSRYVGQFGKDDENRAAAIAWAQEMLRNTDAIAQEALGRLGDAAEALAGQLETMLKGATTTITTNINEAASVIAALSFTLGELDRTTKEALERLGTAALDSLEPLRQAMNGAAGIFTEATGAAASGLTDPEVGFNASLDRSAARVDAFTGALDRAIAKLNTIGGDGTTAPPSANSVQTAPRARVSARDVVPLLRRYSGALKPRVV